MNILKYKEFEGTAEIDMDRMVCRGKLLFIDDLVTYEAKSPGDLQKEFQAAVEDYLETCKELGRNPKRPLKGQFNVRVSQDAHKAAVLRSVRDQTTLNDVVGKALDAYLRAESTVNHNVTITVDALPETLQTITAITTNEMKWETRNVH